MRLVTRIFSIALVGFTLAMAHSAPASAAEDGSKVPMPSPSKAFKGEQCVEPVETMRRDHMLFLKHQRDDTLRDGIRGEKYGLNECIDCHATKSPDVAGGEVRTIEPFCGECHAYAAVKIDCFECHTGAADDKPKQSSSLPIDHGGVSDKAMLMSMMENYLDQGANK